MNLNSEKLIRAEKKMYFMVVYLMFYGTSRKRAFCRDMGIGTVMLDAWLNEKQTEAEEFIRTFKNNLKKEFKKEFGISSGNGKEEIPTVESIKEHILMRLYEQVRVETDPAKLSTALKVLQKYASDEDEKRNSKKASIYDDLKNGEL